MPYRPVMVHSGAVSQPNNVMLCITDLQLSRSIQDEDEESSSPRSFVGFVMYSISGTKLWTDQIEATILHSRFPIYGCMLAWINEPCQKISNCFLIQIADRSLTALASKTKKMRVWAYEYEIGTPLVNGSILEKLCCQTLWKIVETRDGRLRNVSGMPPTFFQFNLNVRFACILMQILFYLAKFYDKQYCTAMSFRINAEMRSFSPSRSLHHVPMPHSEHVKRPSF